MLGWLCIVQSLWAYTPGVRAGAECGAAALTLLGATPLNPIFNNDRGFSTVWTAVPRCTAVFIYSRLLLANFRRI